VRGEPRQKLRGRERRPGPVEKRTIGDETPGVELARAVIDRHENHDEAAHPVDRHDPASGGDRG